jgi:hypothetical protein
MRSRLQRDFGTTANQVLWRGQVPLLGDANYVDESIVAMDQWLSVIEKDPRDIPLAQKVIKDKPASIQDRCTDGNDHAIPPEECDAVVQAYTDPRIEAGMPFADDTIKCELKPLLRSDYYPVQFNDAQWAALQNAYPNGVCDYTKPGVDRVPTQPWQSYQDANGNVVYGGRALGPVPASEPLSSLLPASRRCVDTRKFKFRLHHARGARVVAVRLSVNGRRALSRRGRDIGAVTLRRLPKSTFTVRIVVTYSNGSKRTSMRTYIGCKKSRPRTRSHHHRRRAR